MSETYTVSAKTVDEAIDLASKLYGGKNKEISHDIISLPKKGFLGFGSKDAVIRVTVTEAEDVGLSSIVNELKSYKNKPAPETGYTKTEEAPAKVKKAEKPQEKVQPKAEKAQKPQQTQKSEKVENKPVEKAQKPQEKVEKAHKNEAQKSEKAQKPQTKQKNNKPAEKAQKPQQKAEATPAEAPRADDVKIKAAVSQADMEFAIGFVNKMAENMNLSATAIPVSAPEGEFFTTTENETVYPAINIEGDDTGILIGHHGETLDAIQYLVNLALFRRGNEKGRENIKITVDIENYREKREETLRALARRMASRAVKYKRNVFLEPMNPYERRIIHSELQEYPNVATHSVGSDINRKIIITYEGADKAPVNNKKRSRNGGNKNRQQKLAEPQIPQGLPLPTLDDIEE